MSLIIQSMNLKSSQETARYILSEKYDVVMPTEA